jgi:hypothetical protein
MPFPGPCRRCCWRAPVLFSGSSSILFPRLFFLLTTVPLARAQRLASFFPTHVSPHDSAAADNQRRSFWNVIDPPPYRRWSVIDYHRRSLNLGENVICITFGILIFLDERKRSYWESIGKGDSRVSVDSIRPQSKRLVSRLSCFRYTSTLSLSLASIWLTGVHSNFPRRQLDLVVHKWRMRL